MTTLSAVAFPHGAAKTRIIVFEAKGAELHRWTKDSGGKWSSAPADIPTSEKLTGVGATKLEGSQRVYAFVSSSDGHLRVNYSHDDGDTWDWRDQGKPEPSGGVFPPDLGISAPGVVSYMEGGKTRIYAFVAGGSRLHVNFWRDSHGSWEWADQGHPYSVTVSNGVNPSNSEFVRPGAVAFPDSKGVYQIYAFAYINAGFTSEGFGYYTLYANRWDGSDWSWEPYVEAGLTGHGPGVITYEDEAHKRRIYAFAPWSGYKNLGVNYMVEDSVDWNWVDQGQAKPDVAVDSPAVVTYTQGNKQRIYAFALGRDGHLHVNYWNGEGWRWADRGHPFALEVGGYGPAAVTYQEYIGGPQHIEVFAHTSDGELWSHHWDGAKWAWERLGQP